MKQQFLEYFHGEWPNFAFIQVNGLERDFKYIMVFVLSFEIFGQINS